MPDPYAAPAPSPARQPGAGGLPRLLDRFRQLGAPEGLLLEVAVDWEEVDPAERRRWVTAPDGALLREIEAYHTEPEQLPEPKPEPDGQPLPPIIGAADDYQAPRVAPATDEPRVGLHAVTQADGTVQVLDDAGNVVGTGTLDPDTGEVVVEVDLTGEPEPEAAVANPIMEGWPYPDGNVQAVLDWVGDDTWKAEQALLAEGARDGGPRSTVTSVLERQIERAQAERDATQVG